jgi:hypothetical protein
MRSNPDIYLEEPVGTTRNRQESQCPGQISNELPPFNQHKSDALPLHPTCSVLPEEKSFLRKDLVILKAQLISYTLILSRHSEYGPETRILIEICFRLISTYNYGSRVQPTPVSYHYSSLRTIHKRTHFLFSTTSN